MCLVEIEVESCDTVARLKELIWHAAEEEFENIGPAVLQFWWIPINAQHRREKLTSVRGLEGFISEASRNGYVSADVPDWVKPFL